MHLLMMASQGTDNLNIREELISTAVKFLSNPNIQRSPLEQRERFLRSKGLTDLEIQKAFEQGAAALCSVPAVASSELLMYRHSRTSWFKEILISMALCGGMAYGVYWIYKKWVETLLFGVRPKKKTVDDKLEELNKSLEKSMNDLKQEIITVRSEVDRLSNLQNHKQVSRGQIDGLKSDIASIKGILLNRNQFPTLGLRAEPPSIPAWQLQSSAHLEEAENNSEKEKDDVIGGGGSDSGGSNSSEGEVVTKNSDSSLEIITSFEGK